MTGLPLTGGCNCGAVRFEVTAPLVGASYCHCKRCQRRSGTAASANAADPIGIRIGRLRRRSRRPAQRPPVRELRRTVGADTGRWPPPAPAEPPRGEVSRASLPHGEELLFRGLFAPVRRAVHLKPGNALRYA